MRTLALLLLAGCASIAQAEGLNIDPWTTGDTVRQGALTALLVADWAQTRYIVKHPETHQEANPLMGEHPSLGKVNNLSVLSIVGHYAIARALPREWRHAWQYVFIGVELDATTYNARAGVKMEF